MVNIKFITHLYLQPILRKKGTTPVLPLHGVDRDNITTSHIKFIGHTKTRRSTPSKYFVSAELRKAFHIQFVGRLITYPNANFIIPDVINIDEIIRQQDCICLNCAACNSHEECQ